MNPFLEKPRKVENTLQNWQQLYPKSYDKREIDPYTKTRIILMNGTEFEANWFSHQFARHTDNNDLRRELALTRAIEKQQQIKISKNPVLSLYRKEDIKYNNIDDAVVAPQRKDGE